MASATMLNIFVLGLDEPNSARLQELPEAADYRFHQLLTIDELRHGEQIPIRELLDKATAQLEMFDGHIDAVVGYWDFPVTQMVPILCRRFGLRSPTLEAVLKCEHKYWSRLVQSEVIDEYPRFALVDPADEDAGLPAGMSYPVWVKPVKSASSASAYYVTDDRSMRAALDAEREQVGRMGQPFDYILSLADLPAKISKVGGQTCLVEEMATGDQITVEGYAREGRVVVYGVVDAVTYPDSSSFLRYQYPSRLPEDVVAWIIDVTERVIGHIGLENSTFNIEYFWDPDRRDLRLLEINPRHSQSHATLFQLVDGVPNHRAMIDLALGREPVLPRREGPYAVAAKWFPRLFADGVVRRCPSRHEIEVIEKEIPGTTIEVIVKSGDRLSELPDQDSYSYGLANIHVGAADEAELIDKYRRCLAALPFRLTPP
ncbi:MAG: ATP-grasp domain-containing protein [Actinomycetota bacterium]